MNFFRPYWLRLCFSLQPSADFSQSLLSPVSVYSCFLQGFLGLLEILFMVRMTRCRADYGHYKFPRWRPAAILD